MTKGEIFGISMISVLSLGVGGFIGFPVFAEGPVDISIVEKVDDGHGGYKEWEDITGAMPGCMTRASECRRNGTSRDCTGWG